MASTKPPIIALNMIVKNESSVILRLLESVIDEIDMVVIQDTGSTDNTKELVFQFMAKHKNKYINWLPDVEFKNFGYNRTLSLKGCIEVMDLLMDVIELNESFDIKIYRDSPKYILLMDADMIFTRRGNKSLKEYLMSVDQDAGLFTLFQGSNSYYYLNARIVKSNIYEQCEYKGPTHEYLATPDGTKTINVACEDFFIEDVGDGGAKSNKFERDVKMLKEGLQDEPDNYRYMFYLANSYASLARFDEAIEAYKRRIEMGHWYEEVWVSYLECGRSYMRQGKPFDAIGMWLEAFQYNDFRIENLYEIIKYYRENSKYRLAYHYYVIAKNTLSQRCQREDVIFYEKSIYEYRLDFEMTIIGNYYNPNSTYNIIELYTKVLNNHLLDDDTRKLMLSNLKFEATKLCKYGVVGTGLGVLPKLLKLDVVRSKLDGWLEGDMYYNSTPTICHVKTSHQKEKDVLVIVRFVNYRVDKETGDYIQAGYIGTENLLVRLDASMNSVLDVRWLDWDRTLDKKGYGQFCGLEDVRLLSVPMMKPQTINTIFGDEIEQMGETLIYNCNRGLNDKEGRMTVECGIMDIVKGETSESLLFSCESNLEKNWVCFTDKMGVCKFVYNWENCIIGKKSKVSVNGSVTQDKFIETSRCKTPPFFKGLRGSSNGIKVKKGEIWFISHLVSYDSNRRYYYHCFIVLDEETLTPLRYSTVWTFNGSPVEYCLSFIVEANDLIIGYSTMDNTTEFLRISITEVEKIMIMAE